MNQFWGWHIGGFMIMCADGKLVIKLCWI